MQGFHSMDQFHEFMLKHGENLVDMMGDEIDRIEMNLSVNIFYVCLHVFWSHFDIESCNNVLINLELDNFKLMLINICSILILDFYKYSQLNISAIF